MEPEDQAEAASARRRVILHPKTALARRQDRARAFGGHVRGYTVDTDEVLQLLRAQRRLSFRLLATVLLPVGALPLIFRFVPEVGTASFFGLAPLAWVLLGPIALFSIVVVAVLHERRAVTIERRWQHRKEQP